MVDTCATVVLVMFGMTPPVKVHAKSHFSYIHNPMTRLGFLPHLLLHGVQMLMNVVWGCPMTAVHWQSVSILLVATTANANRDM